MAYLRTITRASCNFEGTAWAPYDMTYRRQLIVSTITWCIVLREICCIVSDNVILVTFYGVEYSAN